MAVCVFCQREIVQTEEGWIDPMATGDDSIWRQICPDHDTFDADHVPEEVG